MKINFSKVIFTEKSRLTFEKTDGMTKRWIPSQSDMPVAQRRQQGDGCGMMWFGIV